jgi:hypothetical protein
MSKHRIRPGPVFRLSCTAGAAEFSELSGSRPRNGLGRLAR